MPATSEKQKKFMDAAAHNPAFAKAAGVPTSVAKDFSEASKGMKFGKGEVTQPKRQAVNSAKTNHGEQSLFSKGGKAMDKEDIKQDKKLIKKAFGMHDKQSHDGKKTNLSKLSGGGMSKLSAGSAAHAAKEGRKVAKEMEYDYKSGKKSFAGSTAKKDAHAEKEGRKVAKDLEFDYSKGRMPKMARGGGVETKGKTKGTMVKMCGGGMSKKK